MYVLINEENFIIAMSREEENAGHPWIDASEPNDDIIKWFATGKYKFVDGEYVLQENWEEPKIEL